MNKTYETMVLLDNREVRKGWQALKDNVCGMFSKHGADVVSARRWDERKLAFPISGQARGTYLLVYHKSPTDSLTAVTRELEYAETVLRHLTLNCEEVPAEAHEPEAEFDESAVRTGEEEDAPADEAKDAKDAKGDGAEDKAAKDGDAEAAAKEGDADASKDGDAEASKGGDAEASDGGGEAKSEDTEKKGDDQ